MQSTRWTNNNPMMTSKVIIKKRAGSLSAEKIAQVHQQMFEYDLSSNSSPRTYHLRTLLSPESLPSTEATLQHYNDPYYHSQNRMRTSSKLSSQDSAEKGYNKVSSVAYNGSYSNGAEAQGQTPNRRVQGNKVNQINNVLDLEALMPLEAKRLCSDLEQLSSEERKVAMIVDEATFSSKIQQEIDCVGCVSSLHTYLYELSELAKNKPGSVLYFEGFVVYGDRRIGFSEEKVGDIHNIAYILHHHKSKNSVIDELTRSLNIKKKHDGHLHRGKVLSRCLLHSKKPMPSGIWREALQNLIENDINEVASVAEIDESVFLSSLQMHTKKRKFCSTCRDNIMFVYDNMLEEASNCSDCEEECDEEEEEEEEEEGEEEYEETEEGPLEAPKPHQKLHSNEIASVPNTNSTTAATSDYEYINERADNLDGRDTDQGRVISYARKSPGSLLACIKYCPERRKIAIPLEMEIFMEFLSKAESGSTTHTKHANTKEAAQEELVACIGSCLKERLQNIWRSKKSEELARILFMKLVADCVVDGIRQKLEEKNFRLGHKTILEEYLNETEAAEQQKKEKQRQKRQKRKEKKKILKQSEPDNPGDTENNGDEERETGEENDGDVADKDFGELNKIENKDQINCKKQEKKKKKKAKNKESSATYDKVSTDSNTPETKKSIEKKDQVTGVKKTKKEIEEEEKLETKKSNEEVGNIRNNRFMNNEERERRLLIAMGWNEELSENEAGVDEKEVKKLRDKWKEIEASRADFRKNAKEKFMRLLNSK